MDIFTLDKRNHLVFVYPPTTSLTLSKHPLFYSLLKWAYIYYETITHKFVINDGAGDTCAMCLAYQGCENCPIGSQGHYDCHNTPYIDYYNATSLQERAKAALDEFAFLGNFIENVNNWNQFQQSLSKNDFNKIRFAKTNQRVQTLHRRMNL